MVETWIGIVYPRFEETQVLRRKRDDDGVVTWDRFD